MLRIFVFVFKSVVFHRLKGCSSVKSHKWGGRKWPFCYLVVEICKKMLHNFLMVLAFIYNKLLDTGYETGLSQSFKKIFDLAISLFNVVS
jgi:uncharacterized protein YceK